MELLDSIEVPGRPGVEVELLQGDLTDLGPSEGFDILVVSAFPNDYVPTNTSLIGALHRRGISVATLAQRKEIDLRRDFACWLSAELPPRHDSLRFQRILCFEPLVRGEPAEVVGDIFRCLAPILAERPQLRSLALPIVASGDQRRSTANMLPPLLEAAVNWLAVGLPLDRIKIVAYSKEDSLEARSIFSACKARVSASAAPVPTRNADKFYDVFISYSRKNQRECQLLERELRRLRPDIRIFVDIEKIEIGAAWQLEIFENIDRCRRMVAMLSPQYLASKPCKEEYGIAWVRSRESDQNIIFPIYLYSADPLPSYMKYRNFLDCREGDATRIGAAAHALINSIAT